MLGAVSAAERPRHRASSSRNRLWTHWYQDWYQVGFGAISPKKRTDRKYRNTKLEVVEAKAWDVELTEGVAQAKNYAVKLAVRFIISKWCIQAVSDRPGGPQMRQDLDAPVWHGLAWGGKVIYKRVQPFGPAGIHFPAHPPA